MDMASNGLFWRFWSYIVSEIQNEKTASSRPSLLLGVRPRGPLEVDPAMGWLSSSSPSSLKPTWLDHTILPLYGRAVCSAMLYYRSKVFVLDGGFRSRRWQIDEEYHLMEFVLEWGVSLKAIENYCLLDGVRTQRSIA